MPGDAMGCVPGQNCVYVCLAPDEQQEPIFSLARQLVAEAVGSALLVATIVGSGLQAVQLSTDDGVALLGNTVATLGILYVLITVFGKVSGAHFNPLVSLAFCLRREMEPSVCAGFVVVQCLAGLHRGLHHRQRHVRAGRRLLRWQRPREAGDGRGRGSRRVWATAHHIWLLEDGTEKRDIPLAVALCVTAGYWYTSSTSFANPAVTLGRCFTDTFASINPSSYGHFVGGRWLGLPWPCRLCRGCLTAPMSSTRSVSSCGGRLRRRCRLRWPAQSQARLRIAHPARCRRSCGLFPNDDVRPRCLRPWRLRPEGRPDDGVTPSHLPRFENLGSILARNRRGNRSGSWFLPRFNTLCRILVATRTSSPQAFPFFFFLFLFFYYPGFYPGCKTLVDDSGCLKLAPLADFTATHCPSRYKPIRANR